MQFILWDPRDGEPRRDEDGTFLTDGLIGRIGPNNPYVRGYAAYHEGTCFLLDGVPDLDVGAFAVATFSLSGSKGIYRVYRIS